MSRYIDADAFDDTVQRLNDQGWHITNIDYKRMDRVLFEMPTADVVEVVRCEDCRYWDNRFDVMVCNLTDGMKGASDYCSYGERKEEDE